MDITKLQFIKITPLETYIKNFLETYKEKESIPNLNTLYTQPCSFSQPTLHTHTHTTLH